MATKLLFLGSLGSQEIIIIALVILLLFGGKKIPELMRGLGKGVSQFKKGKTLTVYIAGVSKPVILRLRGIVHEKKKSVAELYGAEKLGAMGLKSLNYKVHEKVGTKGQKWYGPNRSRRY